MTQFAWDKAYEKTRISWRGTTNVSPGLPKDAKVLEMGCGNGKNLSALLSLGLKVHGIDFSPHAVKQAKELVERLGGKAVVSVQDVTKTRFLDDYFDAVFCFHVLGHLKEADRKKAVNEAKRVLKTGGILFFRDFGQNDFRRGNGKEVEENSFSRRGIVTHYFNEGEVKGLFAVFKEKSFKQMDWTVTWDRETLPRQEFDCVFEKG